MRRLRSLLLAAVVIAGCSSGSTPPPPNAGPVEVDFQQFVQDQFAATADDTDPVDLNGFRFLDVASDDPNAFDNLLGN